MDLIRRLKNRSTHLEKSKEVFDNAYYRSDFQTYVLAKTQTFLGDLEHHLARNLTIAKFAGLAFVGGQGNRIENIVDLGGGAGIDFFIYRELFGDVNWTCLETEALCQVLANKGPIEDKLRFSTVSDFLARYSEGFDFALYSNSALQYIPEPLSALKSLLLLRPSRVAIVRTPFVTEGEEIRTTQRSVLDKNGPQVGCSNLTHEEILTPLTILNIEIVRELFEQNGYRQICENIQSGSFTKKQRLIELRNTRVRTFDFLALRIDQKSSIRES